MENNDNMLRIPTSATYRITDDEPVLIDAHYEEVSADFMARFLIEKFGAASIFGEGETD